MSSNTIQENYSNVLEYIAKILSIFKCHVDYSQKLTEDCHSLFQLGKLLHKIYEKLLESTNTSEVSINLAEQDPIMSSFEEMVDNAPIDALHNLWAIKSEEIDQNIQSYDEQIIITTHEPPTEAICSLWPVQTVNNYQNNTNSSGQSDDEPIIKTYPEQPEITQPYKLLSKRTSKNNRRIKNLLHKVKIEQPEEVKPSTSQETHKCYVCSMECGSQCNLTEHMRGI